MTLKFFLTNFLLFISISFGFSQGKMSFSNETFDFGNVTEGTLATHEFQFTNKGTEPVIISNVQASCGCTTPFWTKEPVKPGGKGIIKASYNSQGRPGAFTKTITVTSNAETPSQVLTIKGIVVTKPLISPSAKPKFETMSFNLGKVVVSKKHEKTITVTNDGDEPLNFISVKSGCNCVSAKTLPGEIKPGEKAELHLIYLPKQIGTFSEPVSVVTNDKNSPETKIYFRAEVEEDKSSTSVVREAHTSNPFN